ncbi:MAG: sialate O-acetylesterase [Cyclobacteriaceae bacterium]
MIFHLSTYAQLQVPMNVEKIQVVLLLGQSNMKGRGKVPEHQQPHDRIIYMNMANDQWYPAIHPLHTDGVPDLYDGISNAGVGPGLDFARMLVKKDKHTMVALIPCARGGAWIDLWMPGKEMYENAVRRAQVAVASFSDDMEVELSAVLWHQGESDAVAGRYDVYTDKLQRLIFSIRKDLDNPNLPFISGTLGSFLENKKDRFPYYIEINSSLLQMRDEVDNYACVDLSDLEGHIGDNVHFNTRSQQIIGERYAKTFLKLTNTKCSK